MKDIEKMLIYPWLEMYLQLVLERLQELNWEIAHLQKKHSQSLCGMYRVLREPSNPA
jgi:hypothetical protein